ncbi:MAG: thioredoxin-dependent thiol peroxidase [bacterium]|nr:thioredoxin-dependent thiol peroxidase [bacterium]
MKLESGCKAPDFSLRDIQGNSVALSDFRGEKVVLYFYPRDNTPGCTTQACDFRDNFDKFKQLGYKIIGISPDTESSHIKFAEKFSLPFTLLSDPDRQVAASYGAYGIKKKYGKESIGIIRSTFLINENGIVEYVAANVKATGHVEKLLKSCDKQLPIKK